MRLVLGLAPPLVTTPVLTPLRPSWTFLLVAHGLSPALRAKATRTAALACLSLFTRAFALTLDAKGTLRMLILSGSRSLFLQGGGQACPDFIGQAY